MKDRTPIKLLFTKSVLLIVNHSLYSQTSFTTVEEITHQPKWTFFMPWAELVKKHNTIEEIKTLYDSPRVITKD